MQYFFTNKEELMLHHGDAFTWTIPLISKSMKDMCLNLVEFTNDGHSYTYAPEDHIQNDKEEEKQFEEIMQIVESELNFTGIIK